MIKNKKLKGYRVYVFKNESMGSSQNILKGDSYVLVTDGIKGDSSEVDSDDVYLKLVKRHLFGKDILHAEPVNASDSKGNQMFGGKFVWGADSRFRNDVSESPIQLHDRVEKYAVGGEVGNQVNFRGDYGKKRSGIITGKKNGGYTVATNDGNVFVESHEIDGFEDAPIAKKKRFGFFEGGGSIEEYKQAEKDYDKYGEYLEDAIEDENEADIKKYKKLMDEAETKMHRYERKYEGGGETDGVSISRLENDFKEDSEIFRGEVITRGNNKFKIEDDKLYRKTPSEDWHIWRIIKGEKYEGGGEIQSKIDKLNKVVNSTMLPESVKAKAKAEIEKLEKDLHESKETKAEEKAEHSESKIITKEELVKEFEHRATPSFKNNSLSKKTIDGMIKDFKDDSSKFSEAINYITEKGLSKEEAFDVYLGFSPKCDAEFYLTGHLYEYTIEGVKRFLPEIIENKERNIFEAGFKYLTFSKGELEKLGLKSVGIIEYNDTNYKGESVVAKRECYVSKSCKTLMFFETDAVGTGGYSGMYSIDEKEGLKIAKDLIDNPKSYVKDVDFFFNNKIGMNEKVILETLKKCDKKPTTKAPAKKSPNDIRYKLKEGYSYSWVSASIGSPKPIELFGFNLYNKKGENIFKSSVIYDDLKQVKLAVNNRLSKIISGNKKFKVGETVSIIDHPKSDKTNFYKVVGHQDWNDDYGWETTIEKAGEKVTMFENLLEKSVAPKEEDDNYLSLKGKAIDIFYMGVPEPETKTITSSKVSAEKYSNRYVTLGVKNGTVSEFPINKTNAFMNGEEVEIRGGKEVYSIRLNKGSKEKNITKPKPDHKKLLAKIKAKKGEGNNNRASLVPFTETRRKRNEVSDKKRDALPLGKRVSASGKTYYEHRLNRGDVSKEDKFEGGGEVKSSNSWGIDLNW